MRSLKSVPSADIQSNSWCDTNYISFQNWRQSSTQFFSIIFVLSCSSGKIIITKQEKDSLERRYKNLMEEHSNFQRKRSYFCLTASNKINDLRSCRKRSEWFGSATREKCLLRDIVHNMQIKTWFSNNKYHHLNLQQIKWEMMRLTSLSSSANCKLDVKQLVNNPLFQSRVTLRPSSSAYVDLNNLMHWM